MEQKKNIISNLFAEPSRIYQKKGSEYFAKSLKDKIKKAYTSNPEENTIYINANILNSADVLKKLNLAQEKGVKVTILGEKKSFFRLSKDNKELLKRLNAFVYAPKKKRNDTTEKITGNHAKLALFDINGEHSYLHGSSNLTNNGLYQNNEVNQQSENDEENYQELLESFNALLQKSNRFGENIDSDFSPVPLGKQDLKITPEKSTVYTSKNHDLNTIILNRLAVEKFNKGDELKISSFTFNNEKITNVLLELLDKGVVITIYIDKDPLTHEDNYEQIKKLVKKGAKIYVCIKKNPHSVHHSKFMLINRTDKTPKKEESESTQKKDDTQVIYSIITSLNISYSNDFNTLKIDREQKTFDNLQDLAKQYEENKKEFTLLKEENIEDIKKNLKEKKEETKENQKKKRERDEESKENVHNTPRKKLKLE